jgi:CO/xanthine dehydrogenase Mo-binding subunit
MRRQPVEATTVAERATAAGQAEVARTVRRSYSRPYLAHASIGPSCAVAQWTDPGVRVWTHSQGIFNLRADLAVALSLRAEAIVVEHVEGAGCYGHNGADDVAFDAVLLARAAGGRPVKVQWSREDELAWAPFGAAMAVDLEADLDANGEFVAWRCDIWSNGHTTRPGRAKTPTLLAASHLSPPADQVLPINPPLAGGGGAERNAVPLYDLPSLKVMNHRLLVMPVRVSALRSLGAYANVFAIESMVDEVACEKREDPLAFRLRHLSDPRARDVLEAAARRAGWASRPKREGVGWGIGFARYKNAGAYCAVIAEVEAERDIRVRRLVAAVDAGEVISPDGVANQIEGGAIQATSWTIKEAVRFDNTRITSDSWESYPILRFSEVPAVEVEIVSRPHEKTLGAGEASQGPTAAAIGNALYDALGIRVRDLPLTTERIVAAMS